MSGNGQSDAPSSAFDLVVVAASFGGVAATRELFSALPEDFPAPIIVVQHRSADADVLVQILRRRTRLSVTDARDGVTPAAGTIYVAAPSRQLVVDAGGALRYTEEPCSGRQADELLTSAAAVYRGRLLAVILTGALDDGAKGSVAVKASGGRVLAQDRATARRFAMPGAAIATGSVDFVLPLRALGFAIVTLTMLPASARLFRVDRPSWAVSAA